jgi:hypothetical protein
MNTVLYKSEKKLSQKILITSHLTPSLRNWFQEMPQVTWSFKKQMFLHTIRIFTACNTENLVKNHLVNGTQRPLTVVLRFKMRRLESVDRLPPRLLRIRELQF